MKQKEDSETVPQQRGSDNHCEERGGEAVSRSSLDLSGTEQSLPNGKGSRPSRNIEKPQSLPNGKGSPASAPQPEKPQTAEEKAVEYYDQLIRLKAEFENYRKRVEKEKPELVKWGKAGILLKLIPLYDVLLNALSQVNEVMGQNKADDERSCSSPPKAEPQELFKGLKIIFKEFSKVFESEGIQIMETVGKPYDPMAHEVMGTVEGNSSNDGTVVEELQRGFTVGGRVLRPARVRIARKKGIAPDAKNNAKKEKEE